MKTKIVKQKEAGKKSVERDAPKLMAELTQEFVDAKDLNSRAKIRARMKAVLDFCSVDTAYPSLDSGGTMPVAPNPIGMGGWNQGFDAPLYNPQARHGGVLPIPGADNTL